MKKERPASPSEPTCVKTFGGFSVSVNGRELSDVTNRSLKLWNVLAYLIMHRARLIPQTELIDQFWPDDYSANPVSALKTLIYRLRSTLEPLYGPEFQPVLAKSGGYMWNPAIETLLDTDAFEVRCRMLENAQLSPGEQLVLCREAFPLYGGDFLPKFSTSLWVVMLSSHYHSMYLSLAYRYASLLEAAGQFEEMTRAGLAAAEIDPLDERLHAIIIESLLCQGKTTAALTHYENATDLLYRNLGVHPSEELRAQYEKIMSVEKTLETDLEIIQQELNEACSRTGAFVCEYGHFKEAYRLETRRSLRTGACIHVALLTVSLFNGGVPSLKVLNETMDKLLKLIVASLRRGDVVSRYSGAQFLIMLPASNLEDSNMVMERIITAFRAQNRGNFLKLSFKVRSVPLT